MDLYPHETIEQCANNLGYFFFYPMASVFIITFILGGFSLWFNKVLWKNEASQQFSKQKIFLSEELGKLEKEERVLKKEKEVQIVKKEVQKSKTQEELWDEEFEDIQNTKHFSSFEKLRECIYMNNGDLSIRNEWGNNVDTYEEIIPFFHSNNIIEYLNNTKTNISLTQKGRYFMKRYLNMREQA